MWSTENKNNYPNGTLYIPDELSSLSWACRTNVKGDWSLRFKDLKVGYEEDFNNEGGALSNAAKPIKKVVKDPDGTHGTGILPPTPGDKTGRWLASDSWAKIEENNEENNKEITVIRKFKQGSSFKKLGLLHIMFVSYFLLFQKEKSNLFFYFLYAKW